MARIPSIKSARSLLSRMDWVWKDTWYHIREAQIPLVASSLAYTTILSVIPLLAVSFAIFKAFGGLEKLYAVIEPMVLEYLAESASREAMQAIQGFIGKIHAGKVGAGGLIGLIV